MSKKLWLVQWEQVGDRPTTRRGTALVLDGELSTQAVAAIVEAVYLFETASAQEMLAYQTGGRNPYAAQVVTKVDGSDTVKCGHNPYLNAERVWNVRAKSEDELVWESGQ